MVGAHLKPPFQFRKRTSSRVAAVLDPHPSPPRCHLQTIQRAVVMLGQRRPQLPGGSQEQEFRW